MGYSIRHGFDFEAAEKAYDGHAKLLMALQALPSERLLRHLAHQRKGRRDTKYPLAHLWACFAAMAEVRAQVHRITKAILRQPMSLSQS